MNNTPTNHNTMTTDDRRNWFGNIAWYYCQLPAILQRKAIVEAYPCY